MFTHKSVALKLPITFNIVTLYYTFQLPLNILYYLENPCIDVALNTQILRLQFIQLNSHTEPAFAPVLCSVYIKCYARTDLTANS